jgi:hypothetical protein
VRSSVALYEIITKLEAANANMYGEIIQTVWTGIGYQGNTAFQKYAFARNRTYTLSVSVSVEIIQLL